MVIRKMKEVVVDITVCYEEALVRIQSMHDDRNKLVAENERLRLQLEQQNSALQTFKKVLEDSSLPSIATHASPDTWTANKATNANRMLDYAKNFLDVFGEDEDAVDAEVGPDSRRRLAMEDWVRNGKY